MTASMPDNLRELKKRKSQDQDEGLSGKFTRSSATAYTKNTNPSCFICESDASPLHRVSTLRLDGKVRECATVLHEEKLLAKIGTGDLIALEARYHGPCLTMLYRKAEYTKQEHIADEVKPQHKEGIPLAELVALIKETRKSGGELPIFKQADLAKTYTSCLDGFDVETTARPHTFRLKERPLYQVPDLEYFNKGGDVYLAFGADLSNVLHKVHKEDQDDEAILLAKASAIIRKDILENEYTFDGSFEYNCQSRSVPASLLSLAKMILYGLNIKDQTECISKR